MRTWCTENESLVGRCIILIRSLTGKASGVNGRLTRGRRFRRTLCKTRPRLTDGRVPEPSRRSSPRARPAVRFKRTVNKNKQRPEQSYTFFFARVLQRGVSEPFFSAVGHRQQNKYLTQPLLRRVGSTTFHYREINARYRCCSWSTDVRFHYVSI